MCNQEVDNPEFIQNIGVVVKNGSSRMKECPLLPVDFKLVSVNIFLMYIRFCVTLGRHRRVSAR